MKILDIRSKMKRYKGNKDMLKVARRLAVCCLLLLPFAGSTMAQEDAPYVIKKDGNYLAHVKKTDGTWVVKNVTTFHPDSCLWYSGPEFNSSGTNHNYYFFDGTNYRFLAAPFAADETPFLSASLPYTYQLRNTDDVYYFYDWDPDDFPTEGEGAGVARGHRYYVSEDQCTHDWKFGQCWEVYWVEYRDNIWQTSHNYSYDITDYAGRFRKVTVEETITPISGGLTALNVGGTASTGFAYEYVANGPGRALSATVGLPYNYSINANYTFENVGHPYQATGSATSASYKWTLSGDGAQYLSFSNASNTLSSTSEAPTLYYRTPNTTGDKTATLTLTVSYNVGRSQTISIPITVKTPCQNPEVLTPVVNRANVIVSWYNTNATSYTVSWKKESDASWNPANAVTVNGTSYTFSVTGADTGTGANAQLAYETKYQYKVKAECDNENPTEHEFITKPEPGLVVYGNIYGGGRMADVSGNTEVVVVNCDSLGGVFGGNDIAGAVLGEKGSTIVLGVNANDPNNYHSHGITEDTLMIASVYGGGNGYYSYDSTTFKPIPATGTNATIHADSSVYALSPTNQWNVPVWTNPSHTRDTSLVVPSIVKTAIVVNNDFVKVDSLFGGAKNAFLTYDVPAGNSDTITINGGTIFALYGGNNVGGSQKRGKHCIVVNQTKTNLTAGLQSTAATGTGRDFGIRYLFGGGNKVAGSTTDIYINGGQMDTVFGGGNAADVVAANVRVNCTGSNVISNAFASGGGINPEYAWDGTSVYNVHTLFGGNNQATMTGIPHITLESGGIGTIYGGGNAGDMAAHERDTIFFESDTMAFQYGTHVVMNSNNVAADYLYGGCQVSNVAYSTWVEIKNGHIGTVYGGCNVSGDVGSERVYPDEPGPKSLRYQTVQGGTYVKATGGTVYRDFFAGSNGFYHCNDGTKYKLGVDYGDPEHNYIGMLVPTHNETHVVISKDDVANTSVTVKGDLYAGANLACVGFTNFTIPRDSEGNRMMYPQFVGLSSLCMDGGRVEGSVYGGGRMASVYGSNEVRVAGGYIGGALYGGNDRTGQVAQITNRVWPISRNYTVASDGHTSLATVHTYVGITGEPRINTVYGGGNGAYIYEGEGADMEYCLSNDQPIQSNTFVDVNIDNDGHINTVYGGGNGVTVTGEITVFLNVEDAVAGTEHVGTIFGGNNLGSLDILSNIILLRGQVDTVYGGCNKGGMVGGQQLTVGGQTYNNVGSYVNLRNAYTVNNPSVTPNPYTVTPTAVVSGAVYGGCRMNGVTNNSLVLVEGGNHPQAQIFGGSDISGDVSETSRVVVTGGTVKDVFGGGNGNYYYVGNKVYDVNNHELLIDSIDEGNILHPYCDYTQVDMQGGTTENVYGGGNAAGVNNNVLVNLNDGTVSKGIYGGSCAADTIFGNINVNIKGGTLGTSTAPMTDGIFGGGYGAATATKGNVTVTVGDGTTTPTIYADIYGGSALGKVNDACSDITKIDFKNGTLYGKLFGGGMGAATGDSAIVNGQVEVNLTNGSVRNGVYGGCNLKGGVSCDIDVNILGGSVGHLDSLSIGASKDVFGGGYGAKTATSGNVAVTVDTVPNSNIKPIIYGDVYGGSGYGSVNTYNSGKTTTVTILNGTIDTARYAGVLYGGNVYGGGLGDTTSLGAGHHDYPAKVYGKIYVNIGDTLTNSSALCGHATINGSVYGCNNVYGSPQDDVFVNIFKTAHVATPNNNFYPTISGAWNLAALYANEPIQAYAISAVYGGGNKAAYVPSAINDVPRTATVHVWGCEENTVCDVYGGGNAADVGIEHSLVVNTRVIIDGGRIHRMFGGGNGYGVDNPGANIFGTATSVVYAGLIDEVYGGANMKGSIDIIDLNMEHSTSCGHQVYGSVFGCANAAPINHSVTTNIRCDVGEIGELYGGSNLAAIGVPGSVAADVTLNIYGGDFVEVFGGSKGALASGTNPSISADIYGNVELNIYSGKIRKAFGGSDVLGNVFGSITVNVDTIDACTFHLDTVFGAGRLTAYKPYRMNGTTLITEPNSTEGEIITSPIVNIKNGTVMKAVFGGGEGNTATTTANPQINIGETRAEYPLHLARIGGYDGTNGDVYGGGFKGSVRGGSEVNIRKANTIIYSDIFGGGDMADVDSTVVNVYDGIMSKGIYGGCNVQGTVNGDIEVNIYGGTLGNATTSMVNGIFGGGRGGYESTTNTGTHTSGNITVTIDKYDDEATAPTIYADVYGGSAFGQVGANDKLTKVDLKNGTIHGTLYGGGMGDASHTAEVTGAAQLAIAGDVTDGVYGGCNVKGIVKGDAIVGITDGTIGIQNNADRGIVYGGGLGELTKVIGKVDLTVNGASVNIYGDVYGGSAKGLVNCNQEGSGANSGSKTDVTLKNGTIHGDLYGGGHGPDDKIADVWGPVAVKVEGGTVDTVYGGNNLKGTPKNTITVTIDGGTISDVFGGGNVANYTAPSSSGSNILYSPYVKMTGGHVTDMVVGGGNLANITGNTKVELVGGTLGEYGTSTTAAHTASVFGGGYGEGTQVYGNVLVNFGEIRADETTGAEIHTIEPVLYGDLYGGSALGNVNTPNGTDSTTVNLLNGTISAYHARTSQNHDTIIFSKVYGGGLGRKAATGVAPVEAMVYGKVHVNVGKAEDPTNASTFMGQATLIDCDVYGCNNLNGSPQQNVYVDIFKTAHIITDSANYVNDGEHGAPTYAIHEVIGGGNQANFTHPGKMNIVYVHKCENTVERLFGGGNAADVYGVDLTIDGGRFNHVFGGGNGEVTAANIGAGGITILLGGGHINMLVNGSNDHGTVSGEIHSSTMPVPVCNEAEIIDYFLGNNQTDLYEDITTTIRCGDGNDVEMKFVNLYCGSNLAQIYANINVTIEGGIFENVFGGSKGRKDDPNGLPDYSSNIHVIKQQDILEHPGQGLVEGEGGNINLLIKGGTIGNLYGGCDVNGNIEGKIDIEVYGVDNTACPLFIGNIYGGGNQTAYTPDVADGISPKIKIIKGNIGGSTTALPINNPNQATTVYEGNVYGGGNRGYVISNPKVIVGNGPVNTLPVTIEGNVYGGGCEGQVTGSPDVVIVPVTHTLTVYQQEVTRGVIKVTNSINENMLNDNVAIIGESLDVKIEAEAADGYEFVRWTVTGTGASVGKETSPSTTFTMGTSDATITAIFRTR